MVGIHLLLLHWNCPSSHSSVAGREGKKQQGISESRWMSNKLIWGVVTAWSSNVICKWMPNWYAAFIWVNWLRRRRRRGLFSLLLTCFVGICNSCRETASEEAPASHRSSERVDGGSVSLGYYREATTSDAVGCDAQRETHDGQGGVYAPWTHSEALKNPNIHSESNKPYQCESIEGESSLFLSFSL